MTLTVARQPLAAALADLRRLSTRAITIPVLRTVRLAAAGGVLTAQATDMDVWQEVSLPCEGDLPACCPDGERIAAAVAGAAGERLSLALVGERLALRHEAGRGAVTCLPGDEFPCRPPVRGDAKAEIDGADLALLIGRVAYAVCADQTRHHICGAFLEADAARGRLLLTATDGHRLAHAECPAAVSGASPGVTIPRTTLDRLAKAKGAVRLALSERQVEAAWEGAVLCSRLIDGSFPEWRRIVPRRDDDAVAIDLAEMGEAAARVGWATVDKACPVWLSVNGKGSYLAARGADGDEGFATLASASDRRLSQGFNGRFLRDACEAVGGEALVSVARDWVLAEPVGRDGELHVLGGFKMSPIEMEAADA